MLKSQFSRSSIIKCLSLHLDPNIDFLDFPLKLSYSEQSGMHLVASRDIDEGEIILKECPIAVSLDSKHKNDFCNMCSLQLSPEEIKNWKKKSDNDPNCILCEGCCSNQFIKDLCNLVYKSGIKFCTKRNVTNEDLDIGLYYGFFRLFFDYSGSRSNALEDDIINFDISMGTLLAADIYGVPSEVEKDLDVIVDSIYQIFTRLSGRNVSITKDEILLMCKIFICNQHAISDSSPEKEEIGRAFCPVAALLNHSCDSNVSWEISSSTEAIMICSATRAIKKGEILTISYFNQKLLDSFGDDHFGRRDFIYDKRKFICSCTKCSQICNVCKKTDSKNRCSKCKSIYYCTTDCQQNDWKIHKILCNSLRMPLAYF